MSQQTKILVIGAGNSTQRRIEGLLKERKYDVIGTSGVEEGQNTQYSGDFSLFVVDADAESKGEIIKQIRKNSPLTPVLSIITKTAEEPEAQVISDVACSYVTKLVKEKALVSAVEGALNFKKSVDELIQLAQTEAISRTAVTLNHEINNPLNVIMGNAQLLLANSNTRKSDTVTRLKAIQDSCLKIHDVVWKLSELIKAEVVEYHGGVNMIDVEKSESSESKEREDKS